MTGIGVLVGGSPTGPHLWKDETAELGMLPMSSCSLSFAGTALPWTCEESGC